MLRLLALLTGLGLVLAGCQDLTLPAPTGGPARTVSVSAPARNPAPGVQAKKTQQQLDSLAVKGRAAKTGYARAAFGPAWADVDRNGCDTRNDILGRDLDDITYKAGTRGCVVLTGTLDDPYSGDEITFRRGPGTSAKVQIDHVVALSNAWQTGAAYWTQARREQLANDPAELLAVDGSINESKGDGDAATWLPPAKGYRCAYVSRQIAVKATYGLWVTKAEKAAMTRILSTC